MKYYKTNKMILTIQDMKGFGFRMSNMEDEYIQRAIDEAELSLIKPSIGDEAFVALSEMDSTDFEIIGGISDGKVLAGYVRAAANITYAKMLFDDINVTDFGSVQKTDEYSRHTETFNFIKHYESVGFTYLRELCRYKGWKYVSQATLTNEM